MLVSNSLATQPFHCCTYEPRGLHLHIKFFQEKLWSICTEWCIFTEGCNYCVWGDQPQPFGFLMILIILMVHRDCQNPQAGPHTPDTTCFVSCCCAV